MENNCPYPGLRPFKEEESVYFKGREEQVQKIVESLEGKKFLMLTGASGDGKSSLVYAGFIPYVKAGFFKAKFNNWIIADFRPERTPLKNLAKSLSHHLELNDQQRIERELSFGFSSLVNLYKSSSHHLDYKNSAWLNANESERKELKDKASNLMILTDQFEEFFTNSENYVNDTPSLHSQVVVNLLLETARIALEEDLPIYIICTMRSDFIGQCVSFRGLPEYIGANQFFVPRLKRHEVHQIIAEPVLLNGNKISNRLVETLINQLGEGYDQLPVLQHALKRLWIAAKNGLEELDLLHLAKLSGLHPDYLSPVDKNKFENWISDIPDYKKSFFNKPSLENVLHFHANELYENACEYYNRRIADNNNQLTQDEAKLIIKKTFQCLTKIDGSRAVRNRMKLEEVVNIINDLKIDGKIVGGLLEIFREPDSTFIRPFIDSESGSRLLNNDDILDITHESLIRNWGLLKQWTDEENENWVTFLDFDKQLQRWISHSKSKDYLLPLGSLAFFESWFNSCNPNKYWIKKYDESTATDAEKNSKAQYVIENTIEFLKSSRKAIGRKRNILLSSATLFMILLTGFSFWAFVERGKAIEQKQLADNKTQEAIQAQQEALRLKNIAELAEQKALESQNIAVSAKDIALKSKERAVASEKEALRSKTFAEAEAKRAFEQSQIAKKEKEEADTQKKIAQKEKEKAEKAEIKTRQLSLVSLSQNLAFKAGLQDDQQLQGLLAMQAYRFTNQNEGNVQDPIIYESLRSAHAALQSTVIILGSKTEARAITQLQNNYSFVSVGKDGQINNWNINSEKTQYLTGLTYPSPIDFVTFNNDGTILISGHSNNVICLWNINNAWKLTPLELKGHKGLLRAVAFSPTGSSVATAGKDSALIIWNTQTGKPTKTIKVKAHVKSMQFVNANSLAIATEQGTLELISIDTESSNVLYTSKTSLPICCNWIQKINILAVGFSDGKIRLFNINSSSGNFKEINDNFSRIELIVSNNKGDLIAVACSDKTIKLYDLDKPDLKPIQLKDHKSKVRSMVFSNDEKIIAGCEDKTIRVWETSSKKLAEQLCAYINRNMTLNEWKQFIGNEIDYEKTCNK